MSNSVSFLASAISIEPQGNLIEVELEVSDSEYNNMLDYFVEPRIVKHFGAEELLRFISDEDIIDYCVAYGLDERLRRNDK